MDSRIVWGILCAAVVGLLLLTAGGTRPARVLLLGDSLGVGLAGPFGAEARRRGVAFTASVKGSTIVSHWLPRLPVLLRAHSPVLVVVSLGTNDCRDPDGPACAAFARRAANLTKLCNESGARVVWLIPEWLDWADEIEDRIPTAAVALRPVVRVQLQSDRIHPTPAGYAAWSADLARSLLQ